jgi:ferric-dicitrate binding protein FerR (iron transport regulator)
MDSTRLIYKVLSGEADEAERKTLRSWMDMAPENAAEFEDIKLAYEAELRFDISAISEDEEPDDGWQAVQQRIFRARRQQRWHDLRKSLGTATLISAVVFAAIFYYVGSNETVTRQGAATVKSTPSLTRKLTFQDATLQRVFEVLHSRYGIDILVANAEVGACRFSGTFSSGISIDDVLRTLARSQNLQLEFKPGRTFEFKGKGCTE